MVEQKQFHQMFQNAQDFALAQDLQSAYDEFFDIFFMAASIKDRKNMGNAAISMGNILKTQQKLDEAQDWYEKAQEVVTKNKKIMYPRIHSRASKAIEDLLESKAPYKD